MGNSQILTSGTVAVIAAIITSFLAPYLLQSSARRIAKAKALEALLEVELARWNDTSFALFRKRQIELKAAVLVANRSRAIVSNYTKMAGISRSFSEHDKETGYVSGGEYMGGIPTDVANCVSDAAEILSKSLWRPKIAYPLNWFVLKKQIKKQDLLREKYRDDDAEHCWNTSNI